jgi:hypothetical protein
MALKPIAPESTERFCGLVIAPAKMGKTSLIRTVLGQVYDIPTKKWGSKEGNGVEERVCVLSAESGLLCIRDLIKAGKVEGFEIGSLDDFKEAYNLLATDQEFKKRYQWVFIDSLTEISDRCNKYMKDKYPEKNKTFDRWDDYTILMTTLIKGFRDLTDYNVIFTCLPTFEKDQDNRRYAAPNIVGKGLKELLTSFFDEVFYMKNFQAEDGTEYRAFITQPWEEFPAGDRSGKLDLVEKPDLAYIRSKILNGNFPF